MTNRLLKLVGSAILLMGCEQSSRLDSDDQGQTSDSEFLLGVSGSYVCGEWAGEPMHWQGSGICSGNNRIDIDLSTVYPGWVLTYNSSIQDNYLGFGKGWSFSEVSLVNTKDKWLRLGNGQKIALAESRSGAFSNKWLAMYREVFSGFLDIPPKGNPVEYDREGTRVDFSKIQGQEHLYYSSQSQNRYGEKRILNVGVSDSSPSIIYPGRDNFKVARTSTQLQIWLENDPNHRFVTLTFDNLQRLVGVRVGKYEAIHSFLYHSSTSLVKRHVVQTADSDYFEDYEYDVINRLNRVSDKSQQVTNFKYQDSMRSVSMITGTGQILDEIFDAYGRMIETRTYTIGNHSTPLSINQFEYNSDNRISREREISGHRIEYSYNNVARHALSRVTRYDESGKIFSNSQYTVEPLFGLVTDLKQTNQFGKTISDLSMRYSPGNTALVTLVENRMDKVKTEYSYSGRNTEERFFRQGVKMRTTSMTDGRPTLVVDHQAPNGLNMTKYEYDERGRLISESNGRESTSYTYDSRDHLKRISNSDGSFVDRRIDHNGQITGIWTKYVTGITKWKEIETIRRSDGSVEKIRTSTTYPYQNSKTREETVFANKQNGNQVLKYWVHEGKEWRKVYERE